MLNSNLKRIRGSQFVLATCYVPICNDDDSKTGEGILGVQTKPDNANPEGEWFFYQVPYWIRSQMHAARSRGGFYNSRIKHTFRSLGNTKPAAVAS